MPTFLELCQTVHEEVGESGTITAVASATGNLLKIVNEVIKANRKIQLRKGNWGFLWTEETITTVADQEEYSAPTGLDSYDEASFWIHAGTINAYPLVFKAYKEYRDVYKNQYLDSGNVAIVTEKPNRKLGVIPAHDTSGDTISLDGWMTPVDLVADADVSLIPEQFHGLIVSQAKQYFAARKGDNGMFDTEVFKHETEYRDLKAHSLPGNKDDNRSESTTDLITVVE